MLPTRETPPRESRGQLNARILLGGFLLALGVYTLLGFMPALVWGSVFVIALWPFFERVRQRGSLKREGWALPIIFTLVTALIFIIPLTIAGLEASQDIRDGVHYLIEAQRSGLPPPDFLARLPIGAAQATNWWQSHLGSPAEAHKWLGALFINNNVVTFSRHIGTVVLHRAMLFGCTLLTILFLFRYGEDVAEQIGRVTLRLFGPRGEHLRLRIVDSVRGTVSGLVLVGLGEGLFLGIAYWFAGVPHTVLFAAFTSVAAMIPFGAPIAYTLASLLLITKGLTGWAIFIFALGSVILFFADHFVRPGLIGGATSLPFIWVLLGILGGVESWGLLGLFIGPAIMAALLLLWRELSELSSPIIPAYADVSDKERITI